MRTTPWWPHKWSRPSSISTPAAGEDRSENIKIEALMCQEKPPSVEVPPAMPLASPKPSQVDTDPAKKKARLGWGQGLAKYEKQKVQGSSEMSQNIIKVADGGEGSAKNLNVLPLPAIGEKYLECAASAQLQISNEAPKSEQRDTVNEQRDTISELPIKFDQLGSDPLSALTGFLSNILQPEDASDGACLLRSTKTNKLMHLKEEISKELEKTELEIDLLENEMRALDRDAKACSIRCEAPAEISCTNLRESEKCDKDVEASQPLSKVEFAFGPSERAETHPDTALHKCEMLESFEETGRDDNEAAGAGWPSVSTDTKVAAGCVSSIEVQPSSEISEIISSILLANKAVKASSEFKEIEQAQSDPWGLSRQLRRNEFKVRNTLASCKRNSKFKELVLSLKSRALTRLWKEDVRLISIRKNRSKSSKRNDSTNRASQIVLSHQGSSSASQATLTGDATLVPTVEMVDVMSKMLSELDPKPFRDNIKMPSLIVNECEKGLRFINRNGLVEDPVSVEKERLMINPWSQAEKDLFMEKLATFGKDFCKISSCLDHKTTADCIEFYYKNHKSDSFREVKRLLSLRKQRQGTSSHASTYLATTSGKKWNPESNAASLDMLEAATAAVSSYNTGSGKKSEKNLRTSRCRSNLASESRRNATAPPIDSEDYGGSGATLNESESMAAGVLIGIYGGEFPRAKSHCAKSSADRGDGMATDLVNCNFNDDEMLSDDGYSQFDSTDWTDKEKTIFLEAVRQYGKDFAAISSRLKTRTSEQCRIFFSKARKSLGLDLIHTEGGSGRASEAARAACEIDSGLCSTQSCSKMDGYGSPCRGPLDYRASQLSDSKPPPGSSNEKLTSAVSVKCIEPAETAVVKKETGDTCNTELGQVAPKSEKLTQNSQDTVGVVVLHDAAVGGGVSVKKVKKEPSSHEQHGNRIRVNGSVTAGDGNVARDQSSTPSGSFTVSGCSGGPHGNSSYQASDAAGRNSQNTSLPVPDPLSCIQVKRHSIPLNPKDFLPVQFTSMLPDANQICFNGLDSKAMTTTISFEDPERNKLQRRSLSPGNDLNSCPVLKAAVPYASPATSGRPFHYLDPAIVDAPIPESHLPHANHVRKGSLDSACGGQFFIANMESRNMSNGFLNNQGGDEQQRAGAGDVKLFGQILSQQSVNGTRSKPQSPKHEPQLMSTQHKSSANSTKSSSILYPVLSVAATGAGHFGMEDHRPGRPFGFLDGSRIPTSAVSLTPESALVLAKYGRSLTGVPFYSAATKSGGGGAASTLSGNLILPEYQSSFEQKPHIQKVSTNGIDSISSFQPPGKATRISGSGILVASSGGVSDPVAALKMHYASGAAAAAQKLRKGGEMEQWREDLGSSR